MILTSIFGEHSDLSMPEVAPAFIAFCATCGR